MERSYQMASKYLPKGVGSIPLKPFFKSQGWRFSQSKSIWSLA